ncbi:MULTISPECIES: hypothetical protein [Ralstonia]|jgi:hypothetical protein|uniref:Uncharacterized protein n=1 Tax=Ralstonia flaminis TaxID=3058597 RepID=A0ABN9JQT9_9RALS|nr:MULTISPECIES: hypothetical protein [unclassified Ralstonia]CAJ0821410.1 hypothetical protein LMG18101_04615 [Ralstonia sp. LMG 18101]
MPYKRLNLVAAVAVVAAISGVAHAQTDKKFDPYSQGANADKKFDPYTQGAKAGDKFDPYSQGANKDDSTASALNPGAQPANVEKGKYDTYTQGAKAGDKFDPYSQGARQGDAASPYSKDQNKQ